MLINIKLDKNFEHQFDALRTQYGETLAKLNGFAEEQLSYTDFIDNFIDKNTVADASIDGNANAGTKDICSLESEMSKPHSKLLSFNKIYYEMCKAWGKDDADEWLRREWDGHFYLHDAASASMKPYCFAYDLDSLVRRGLYFVNNFNASPAKHLVTYTDFVGEMISYTSNRSSGACGLPSFLVYSYYYWRKDVNNKYFSGSPEIYRDQEFQRIVYKLNQPYLRVNQSAFTNFSIYDRPYFTALFGGKEFPDGSFMIDCIDEFMEYQKAFMKVVSEIREQNMMTFPVLTFALLRNEDGTFADEEFAKWCCKHNMKWADSNFFISKDVTSLSNCCFDGGQKVLVKDSNGANLISFEDLYNAPYAETKRNLTVLHNGSWVHGKILRLTARHLYKITTANNKTIYVTDNHLNPTLHGDKQTIDLTTNDYLMFNTMSIDAVNEKDEGLTYEQGFLLGMYLGDGSMANKEENKTTVVQFSLNKAKFDSSFDILQKALNQLQVVADIKLRPIYNNVYPVEIASNKLADFINKYIEGNYAYEKSLNMNVVLQSVQFRTGILKGYYLTDGGNSNRIYTTSSRLAEDIEALLTTLGLVSIIDITDRTDEPVVIRGCESSRNYPVYCIRWYDRQNRRSRKNVYVVRNNTIYFKINSIEPCDDDQSPYVYCFEMPAIEPYFTLPNGIITHNCRLVSDVKNLGYFNSIGGSALEVGSIKVNTINLARIAYESTTQDEYCKSLCKYVILCCKTLHSIRHIIKRNIEKGLLPNYTHDLIHLKSQYNTIGIIGIYETLQKFNMTYRDELGYTHYTDEGIEFAKRILSVIDEEKNIFARDYDYSINIEQIPAERAAAILMQKDKLFFPDEIYELPLYGNQWIPLGVKTTIEEKVRLSAILDKACNGGSIAHINIDAPFNSFETAWKMLNYVADSGVPYFAFCTRISACDNNHGFYGETCPTCGQPKTTTYQRIVG